MTTAPESRARSGGYLHQLRAPGWPVVVIVVAYTATMLLIGDLRPEHVVVAVLVCGAWLATRMTRDMFREAIPAILIVMGFDSLRYLRPLFVTADRVHGCDLRAVELSLFGVSPDATLADYFAAHHSPAFDLFFSVPYAAFIYVTIIYAVSSYFRDRGRARIIAWSFVGMYLIAFTAWMAFPAAPPWYIQAHGCVIDVATQPTAAALMRVDAALGIDYFEGFYGRGPTAFGAMPSVHNAYPMLTLLAFWPMAGGKERAAGVVYALWMICASVYLDHHWLIDGLAGWLTAAIAVAFGTWVERYFPAPPAAARATASA